uniref:Uncharacterized protein n=1 Tax=Setaria italica TaxID=4555 RepID=K3Z1Z3_SETIT
MVMHSYLICSLELEFSGRVASNGGTHHGPRTLTITGRHASTRFEL